MLGATISLFGLVLLAVGGEVNTTSRFQRKAVDECVDNPVCPTLPDICGNPDHFLVKTLCPRVCGLCPTPTPTVQPKIISTDAIDGEGWIIFQTRSSKGMMFDHTNKVWRRTTGAGMVNFNRNWADYTSGFGNRHNFWLGLDAIYRICNKESKCELKIDYTTLRNESESMKYNMFYIDGPSDNYTLHLSGFQGSNNENKINRWVFSTMPETVVSSANLMSLYHLSADGMAFSTFDRDNDRNDDDIEPYARGSCAGNYQGGWWWNNCGLANLNGNFGAELWPWMPNIQHSGGGPIRFSLLTFTEIKMRQIERN